MRPESLADGGYVKLDCAFLDGHARPNTLDQLVPGDEFVCSFDQCRQEVEGTAAERERSAVDPQFTVRQVYFAFA
jgi:hypothetical protein